MWEWYHTALLLIGIVCISAGMSGNFDSIEEDDQPTNSAGLQTERLYSKGE